MPLYSGPMTIFLIYNRCLMFYLYCRVDQFEKGEGRMYFWHDVCMYVYTSFVFISAWFRFIKDIN